MNELQDYTLPRNTKANSTVDLMRFKASVGGKAYYLAIRYGLTVGGATCFVSSIAYCIMEGII